MGRHEEKIAPFKALYWILASLVLVSGSAAGGLYLFIKWQEKRRHDPAFHITSIIQTGPQKQGLSSDYLAELMGLSCDRPANLFQFDVKKAEAALLRSPLIREAKVGLMKPQTVYVDYTVRKPLAWVYEYENCAIDEEGYIFPVYPFFSPKQLPELCLGLPPLERDLWNSPLDGKEAAIGIDLLLRTQNLGIRRVDVSKACAPSLGNREIVLFLEDEFLHKSFGKEHLVAVPRLVRLSGKNYLKELSNLLELRETLLAKEKKELAIAETAPSVYSFPLQVIDLRIEGLGFMGKAGEE